MPKRKSQPLERDPGWMLLEQELDRMHDARSTSNPSSVFKMDLKNIFKKSRNSLPNRILSKNYVDGTIQMLDTSTPKPIVKQLSSRKICGRPSAAPRVCTPLENKSPLTYLDLCDALSAKKTSTKKTSTKKTSTKKTSTKKTSTKKTSVLRRKHLNFSDLGCEASPLVHNSQTATLESNSSPFLTLKNDVIYDTSPVNKDNSSDVSSPSYKKKGGPTTRSMSAIGAIAVPIPSPFELARRDVDNTQKLHHRIRAVYRPGQPIRDGIATVKFLIERTKEIMKRRMEKVNGTTPKKPKIFINDVTPVHGAGSNTIGTGEGWSGNPNDSENSSNLVPKTPGEVNGMSVKNEVAALHGKLYDLAPTQPVMSSLLVGVVAYVEVLSGRFSRSVGVKAMLSSLGATVLKRFTKQVTHVVFNEGMPTTYQKALKLKVHLVSVLWIEACRTAMARVSEHPFLPPGLERYSPINLLYRPFRRLKLFALDNEAEVEARFEKKMEARKKKREALELASRVVVQEEELQPPIEDNPQEDGIIRVIRSLSGYGPEHLENFPEDTEDSEFYSPLAVRLLRKHLAEKRLSNVDCMPTLSPQQLTDASIVSDKRLSNVDCMPTLSPQQLTDASIVSDSYQGSPSPRELTFSTSTEPSQSQTKNLAGVNGTIDKLLEKSKKSVEINESRVLRSKTCPTRLENRNETNHFSIVSSRRKKLLVSERMPTLVMSEEPVDFQTPPRAATQPTWSG